MDSKMDTNFPSNFLLSATSLFGGWLASVFTAENMPMISLSVTILLFFCGKAVDVLIKIYLERKDK